MKRSILVCAILTFSTPGHTACPTADLSGDCKVGLADLAIMAIQWLTEGVPDDPEDLVWVYIDDPGVDEDGDGTPDHEGFTGEMSKYETTNAQYCEFLNAALASGDITVGGDNIVDGASGSNSGEDFPSQIYFVTYEARSYSQITYSGGVFSVRSHKDNSNNDIDMSNHPVVEVSWYGATAFCNYYGYRLPTEWEWQAVADHFGEFTYGCGTTIYSSVANYDNNNPLSLSSLPFTTPVDHYPSWGYGLNDMAGNVWEWTSSLYAPEQSYRVVRGGSWYDLDFYCTVSRRLYRHPYDSNAPFGFRVCR